jgi:excisionase family DNA binding protein
MPRLYDVEKTAELMSISPWTVRSYIRTGHITPVRIGRRVLIEQKELERVIAQGRQPVSADLTVRTLDANPTPRMEGDSNPELPNERNEVTHD